MSEPLPIPPPGFDDLATADKIEYVQSLWERISANPEQVPFPDWHQEIVRERVDAQRTNPEAARPWEEVREDVRRALDDRAR
jgi:putative addiction module component (TIGR02574 family)